MAVRQSFIRWVIGVLIVVLCLSSIVQIMGGSALVGLRPKRTAGEACSHDSHKEGSRPNGEHEHEEALLPVITVAVSAQMPLLRELVGSIHRFRHDNFDVHSVVVFGYRLTARERNELKMWRNVDFFDLETDLMPDVHLKEQMGKTQDWSNISPDILRHVLDFSLRKFRQVVYVDVNYYFNGDSLHTIEEAISHHGYYSVASTADAAKADILQNPVIGLKLDSQATLNLVLFPLQCTRGYQCNDELRKKLDEQQKALATNQEAISSPEGGQVSKGDGGQRFFCTYCDSVGLLFSYSPCRFSSPQGRCSVQISWLWQFCKEIKRGHCAWNAYAHRLESRESE